MKDQVHMTRVPDQSSQSPPTQLIQFQKPFNLPDHLSTFSYPKHATCSVTDLMNNIGFETASRTLEPSSIQITRLTGRLHMTEDEASSSNFIPSDIHPMSSHFKNTGYILKLLLLSDNVRVFRAKSRQCNLFYDVDWGLPLQKQPPRRPRPWTKDPCSTRVQE